MRLEGKVAFISGGGNGMGAVEARLLAKEGAAIAIGDVKEDDGRKVEAEINETGGQALFVRLDVTSESDWRDAISSTVARFGKLDILVNNAGITPSGSLEETTGEDWDLVLAINAKGVFLGTKTAIPEMRKVGGGSIVNSSSVAGIIANPPTSSSTMASGSYNASKGAVRIFTKAVAIQYAADGIRVNSVHPGPIVTAMTENVRANPEAYELSVDRIPMGRFGEPIEVAYGVLYLASDESSFVTGSELVIDGGKTAQ